MSGPHFSHLLVKLGSADLDHAKVAEAARTHVRTLGGGIAALGELMYYACTDEQDVIDPNMGERLGWLLRNLGEQIDETIDLYAESAAIARKEIAL